MYKGAFIHMGFICLRSGGLSRNPGSAAAKSHMPARKKLNL